MDYMKTKEECNKKLAELSDGKLNQVSGGSSIPGLEAIGPYNSENLTPEEIQRLRELGDSYKPTTQNTR